MISGGERGLECWGYGGGMVERKVKVNWEEIQTGVSGFIET